MKHTLCVIVAGILAISFSYGEKTDSGSVSALVHETNPDILMSYGSLQEEIISGENTRWRNCANFGPILYYSLSICEAVDFISYDTSLFSRVVAGFESTTQGEVFEPYKVITINWLSRLRTKITFSSRAINADQSEVKVVVEQAYSKSVYTFLFLADYKIDDIQLVQTNWPTKPRVDLESVRIAWDGLYSWSLGWGLYKKLDSLAAEARYSPQKIRSFQSYIARYIKPESEKGGIHQKELATILIRYFRDGVGDWSFLDDVMLNELAFRAVLAPM